MPKTSPTIYKTQLKTCFTKLLAKARIFFHKPRRFILLLEFLRKVFKIGCSVSDAFGIFCIMQSLRGKYASYLFDLMETSKDLSLIEVCELINKSGDYLRAKS